MKKITLMIGIFVLIIATDHTHARCMRKKRGHEDKNVVRCSYSQEDICRGYAQNPKRYGCCERWKKCFYCGCKLEEHSKRG